MLSNLQSELDFANFLVSCFEPRAAADASAAYQASDRVVVVAVTVVDEKQVASSLCLEYA